MTIDRIDRIDAFLEGRKIGDPCSVTFEYADGGVAFSFKISDEASLNNLTSADWRSVLAGELLSFGEVYGSHVDNGQIIIDGADDKILFLIDGARGGVTIFTISKECGADAFEHLAQAWDKNDGGAAYTLNS